MLGYPILSMRSIPKDPSGCDRFFESDIKAGRIETPLEVQDVWPENYSANSVQKVWAAKFAARHPNVVVLDLSSFKCGHDAPTYGLIDSIICGVGDALLGAARHRRQQAGRLDQDPREDLRALAEAARGAARGHGAPQRRAEVPHGREAPAAAGAEAAAAGGAQAAGSGAGSDDQRDEGKGGGVLGEGRSQPSEGQPRTSRPRTRAWCGSESRSASTTAKSWRAFRPTQPEAINVETVDSKETSQAKSRMKLPILGERRRHRRRRRAEEVRAGADGGARPRGRQGALARRQPEHLHRRAARAHHAADLRPDDGARPVPAGRAARPRLQDQGDRRARQLAR